MAFLQSRSSNGQFPSNTTATLAMPSNVTAGSLLLAGFRAGTGTTFLQTRDSVNGSIDFTVVGGASYDVGAARSLLTYFLNSAAGADTLTYNWTPAATPRAEQAEFSAIQTSGALDQAANNTGTGTTLTAGAVTLTITTNTQFVIAFFNVSADVTFSQSGSWQIASGTNSPGTRTCFVYQEVSASGTYTPTVTASASVTWLGQTASFRSTNTAGGGAPVVQPYTRWQTITAAIANADPIG